LNVFKNMEAAKGEVTVLSGIRTVVHNIKTPNAAKYSQHQVGIGSDPATPAGQENSWVYDAQTKWGFKYAYTKTASIHVDTRWTTSNSSKLLTLKQGSTNPYVFMMEDGIHWHNPSVSPTLTGTYNDTDVSVVKKFQSDHGLTGDGNVGDGTWNKITENDTHMKSH
jgi:murein L,D-transpeptidase YcbB/YkuD